MEKHDYEQELKEIEALGTNGVYKPDSYNAVSKILADQVKKLHRMREDQIITSLLDFGFDFRGDRTHELIPFAKQRLTLVTNADEPYIKNLLLDGVTLVCYWSDEAHIDIGWNSELGTNKFTITVGSLKM